MSGTSAPERPPRRRVPTWLVLAALVVVAVLGYQGWHFVTTPAAVRDAAGTLRTTSAVVSPGAPTDVLDLDRVREVVGDRPIVVAVLPEDVVGGESGAGYDVCDDITRRVTDVLAVVYLGERGPFTCLGWRFPEPEIESSVDVFTPEESWLLRLELDYESASRYRISDDSADRTPEIEELVLAFDVRVERDLPNGVERRVLAASPSVLGRTVALLAGVVVAVVLGFALLQLVVTRLRRRAAAARAAREQRLALTTELAAIADAVLRDEPVRVGSGGPAALARARERADVAGRYVLTLTEVEAASTPAELALAQETVTALRADADRLLPEPVTDPVPAAGEAPARRRRPRRRPGARS